MSDYIREVMDPEESIRIGSYKINIHYRGIGFNGHLKLDLIDFFPITPAQMKRLLKICQIAAYPEEEYIWEFLGAMEYLYVHTEATYTRKRLRANMKLCRDRLNFLGYKPNDLIEELKK